jgi:hypothetical protein
MVSTVHGEHSVHDDLHVALYSEYSVSCIVSILYIVLHLHVAL